MGISDKIKVTNTTAIDEAMIFAMPFQTILTK